MSKTVESLCRFDRPVLSIIIPTCGRIDDLRTCLRILLDAPSSNQFEILVSDDSADPTYLEAVRRDYQKVVWLSGPRRGPAANRNHAAHQARGEWLLFLDDDVVPELGCLNAYFDAISSRSNLAVLEGCTTTDPHLDVFTQEAPVNLTGGALPSCNFAIKRSCFESVGGFRECFTHWMEDVDFHRRIREANIPIEFLASAQVYHPPRRRPGVVRLAGRWRARAFFERLWGASMISVLLSLPWHIFRVRLAQYRCAGRPVMSAVASLAEAWLVSIQLPWWLLLDSKRSQSSPPLGQYGKLVL